MQEEGKSVSVDDFDKQFFQKATKLKLNKGEKRALKFALKKGLDVNEVPDLKEFLQSEMKQSKQTKFSSFGAEGMAGPPRPGMVHGPSNSKTATYKQLEQLKEMLE